MGILGPGVGHTTLGNDGAEQRVGQHIHPWRRRHLTLDSRNHVFAPIRGESAQPIIENKIAFRQLGDRRGYGAMGTGWCQSRHRYFQTTAPVDLVCQCPFSIGDDNVSNRLNQDAVFF